MNRFVCGVTSLLLLVAATFGATQASAQGTFGEFVDKGATKVLKDEWLSILPANITGAATNGDVSLNFHPDGKLSGNFFSKSAGASTITGTWTMDASGRRCIEEYFPAWNNTWKECGYIYKLNGEYHGSTTDSDRSARMRNPLVPYKIKIQLQ